jgi:hypothetical protein
MSTAEHAFESSAMPTTGGIDAWAQWVIRRIPETGLSRRDVATAAGVPYPTLGDIATHPQRARSAAPVSSLTTVLGADPEQALLLAGIEPTSAASPDTIGQAALLSEIERRHRNDTAYAVIAEQAGVTSVWIGKLRANPNAPLRPLELVRAATRLDVLEPVLSGLPSVQKLQGTLRAVEVARLQRGLAGQQMDSLLQLGPGGYSHNCERGRERTDWSLLARMMRFLDESPEQVLEREGIWQNLKPMGRVLAPAMVRKGLGSWELAQKSGTDDEEVRGALYGLQRPNRTGQAPIRATIDRWADCLELTPADEGALRRLAHAARVNRAGDLEGVRLHMIKKRRPSVRGRHVTVAQRHAVLVEHGRTSYSEKIAPAMKANAEDPERRRKFEAVRHRRRLATLASATPEE